MYNKVMVLIYDRKGHLAQANTPQVAVKRGRSYSLSVLSKNTPFKEEER
jgi:hypothetical protein